MYNGQTFKMTSNHLVRHDNQIQQFPLPWAYTSYFQGLHKLFPMRKYYENRHFGMSDFLVLGVNLPPLELVKLTSR